MTVIKGNHQGASFYHMSSYAPILRQFGTVPGEYYVEFVVLKTGSQGICVAPLAGDENIWIFIMKGSESVGEFASFIAFCISDSQIANEAD